MATLFLRSSDRAFSLSTLRARATQVYVLIAWLQVLAVAAIAVAAHNAWLGPVMLVAEIATIATVCALTMKDGAALRSIIAVALMLGAALFAWAGRGDASVNYGAYVFAVLAMLVGYVDWRPIAIASSIALAVLGADVTHAALNGATFVAESAVLIWISYAMQTYFQRADDLVNFTSEAIAGELAEKASLQAELDRLRTRAS